jgi:antirestriction protein ArdC
MNVEVSSQRRDVYRAITQKIADAVEAGEGEYRMPWHSPERPAMLPTNATTYAPYRGVNVVSLWVDAFKKGYASGMWASYKQWQEAGAQVRKGERGSLIIFYKDLQTGEANEDGKTERRFVAKASHVFNVAQVSGWQPELPLPASEHVVDQTVEAFVAATRARVDHGYSTARYRRDLDSIEMPHPAWFTAGNGSTASKAYYAILLHELTHWTGASHRLDRQFGERFGDNAYAFEELVAELGAAFLCAELGLANEPRPDHAAYVRHWLQVLDNDPRAIFTAASRAQMAAAYLWGFQAV